MCDVKALTMKLPKMQAWRTDLDTYILFLFQGANILLTDDGDVKLGKTRYQL